MGETTGISWTDHTFNAWWGCQRVSPGCEHCYAEAWAKRTGLGWGPQAERRMMSDAYWKQPLKWNRAAAQAGVRRRVFCSSMADVFESRGDDVGVLLAGARLKLWALIEATPNLDWQLLTKRPENIARMLPPEWLAAPRPNVWLGTTCEDQRRADDRLHVLREVPAAVLFVSAEPLLECVDLFRCTTCEGTGTSRGGGLACVDCAVLADTASGGRRGNGRSGRRRLDWVIVGGESGPGARPFVLDWARRIIADCKAAGTPCFFKQAGARPEERGRVDYVPFSDEARAAYGEAGPRDRIVRLRLKDKKGGDLSELPAGLNVRQFPEVSA
jgi:protein gp37